MRVLLIEDDSATAKSVELMLKSESFNVYVTDLGEEGVDLGKLYDYDIILLDLNLPDMSGYEVLKSLRVAKIKTPILILSGLAGIEDKVKGLGFGADDYLTKPFSTHELMARIRAVLRRKAPEALDSAVELGPLRLDPATRRVSRGEQEVKVGPTEFRLLHFLMTHPERVHSRAQLLDRVWGDHVFIEERTVDVHVKRLREALSPVGCAAMIETVRGAGYRLTQQVAAVSA